MRKLFILSFLFLVCNSCVIFKSTQTRLSEKYLSEYGNVFIYTIPFSDKFSLWSYKDDKLIFSSSFPSSGEIRNRKLNLDENELVDKWISFSEILEKNQCAVLDDSLLEIKIKQDSIITEQTIYISCITEYQSDIDTKLLNNIKILMKNNLMFLEL